MSELLDSTLSAGQKVSQDIKTTRRRAMRRKPIND
jgi:hypothetical protein